MKLHPLSMESIANKFVNSLKKIFPKHIGVGQDVIMMMKAIF